MPQDQQHRPQIVRLREIDARIRGRARVTAPLLAKQLGFGIRTIRRDLEFMKDSLRAPLKYDTEQKRYIYTDPGWELTSVKLTEGELLDLAIAQRLAGEYGGTPLGDALEGLFTKLRRVLPDETDIDPFELRSEFSFHGLPARPIKRSIWKTLAQAIRECRTVKARYASPRHTSEPTLEPLHLANLEGDWYVVARWGANRDPWILAVSRFEKARLTKKTFVRGKFDSEAFFSNRFGRFVGKPGEVIKAVMKFTPEVARDIEERVWHPKQTLKKHRGGGVTLTIPFPSMVVARRWVLQWGRDVEVVGPEVLRTEIGDEYIRTRPSRMEHA